MSVQNPAYWERRDREDARPTAAIIVGGPVACRSTREARRAARQNRIFAAPSFGECPDCALRSLHGANCPNGLSTYCPRSAGARWACPENDLDRLARYHARRAKSPDLTASWYGRNPAGGNSDGTAKAKTPSCHRHGRTPTEVLAVETNATCKCEASAWFLGENGEDG